MVRQIDRVIVANRRLTNTDMYMCNIYIHVRPYANKIIDTQHVTCCNVIVLQCCTQGKCPNNQTMEFTMKLGTRVMYRGTSAVVTAVFTNAVEITRDSGACFVVLLSDSDLSVIEEPD